MSIATIALSVDYAALGLSADGASPTLTCVVNDYAPEIGKKNRTALIICPGGGYEFCSARESEPVALRFAGYGIQAFVLRYSCMNHPFPTALAELAAAVAYVRSHAAQYDVDPDRIAVCGFSAGGHLAGTLGVFWNSDLLHTLYQDCALCRPNAMILCYPVITSGKFRHESSICQLIGDTPTADQLKSVSVEQNVTADTPPTFVWHCADDRVVPVQNTLALLEALSAADVSYEAHIYPYGGHGLAFADNSTANAPKHFNATAAAWFLQAVDWLQRLFPAR